MAAEMRLHVALADDDLPIIRRYLGLDPAPEPSEDTPWTNTIAQENADHDYVVNLPSVVVGDVSWLKASLFGKPDEFIPDAIDTIATIVGTGFPTIDTALIARVREAFTLPNTTEYDLNDAGRVVAFLERYRGRPVFAISW